MGTISWFTIILDPFLLMNWIFLQPKHRRTYQQSLLSSPLANYLSTALRFLARRTEWSGIQQFILLIKVHEII